MEATATAGRSKKRKKPRSPRRAVSCLVSVLSPPAPKNRIKGSRRQNRQRRHSLDLSSGSANTAPPRQQSTPTNKKNTGGLRAVTSSPSLSTLGGLIHSTSDQQKEEGSCSSSSSHQFGLAISPSNSFDLPVGNNLPIDTNTSAAAAPPPATERVASILTGSFELAVDTNASAAPLTTPTNPVTTVDTATEHVASIRTDDAVDSTAATDTTSTNGVDTAPLQPPSPTPSPPPKAMTKTMDLTNLLSHVRSVESALPSSPSKESFFGHPAPPDVHVLHIKSADGESEGYVGLARTKRAACAQLLVGKAHSANAGKKNVDGDNDEANTSWYDDDDDDEPVAAWYVVAGDIPMTDAGGGLTEEKEEEITCAALLTGRKDRVAVVLGNNLGKVLCMELVVEGGKEEGMTLERADDEEPFEPLPLDDPMNDVNNSDIIAQSTFDQQSQGDQPLEAEDTSRELGGSDAVPSTPAREAEENESEMNRPPPEGLPPPAAETQGKKHKPADTQVPFHPSGGVTSLSPHGQNVWITYGDGTTIRLPSVCFFRSSSEEGVDGVKNRVLVAGPGSGEGRATVVPLPTYHPSLLAPPPREDRRAEVEDDSGAGPSSPTTASDDESSYDDLADFHEAIAFTTSNGQQQNGSATMVFYTSEDQLAGTMSERSKRGGQRGGKGGESGEFYDNELFDVMVGATKTLVGGVFGAAVGAVKWGLSSKTNDRSMDSSKHGHAQKASVETFVDDDDISIDLPPHNAIVPSTIFPQLHDPPGYLLPSIEIHDSPRQITSIAVDPDGKVAAVSDALGRVSLVDLSTKQTVRMWKGVRDATCYWIQMSRDFGEKERRSWEKTTVLYLVIHAKTRRVVEIWRMRHGPRVKLMSVGRDAQVVQCALSDEGGGLARCFLVQSTPSGGAKMELLTFIDEELAPRLDNASANAAALSAALSSSRSAPPTRSSSSSSMSRSLHTAEGSGLKLQLLRQLLAQTNVPSTSQAVYNAFTEIESLEDLGNALDLLSRSGHLEEGMGVEGSSFQHMAVVHCKSKLEAVWKEHEEEEGKVIGVVMYSKVARLEWKIQFHSQVMEAYDVLHKFELGTYSDSEDEGDKDSTSPRTPWAVEALSWIETYEKVTGRGIDADLVASASHDDGNNRSGEADAYNSLTFSSFAKACVDSEKEPPPSAAVGGAPPAVVRETERRHRVYFSDSRKTRTAVLVHVFRPLLQDIFVFKVVNSVFDCLGIQKDYGRLQTYFGEWFMTLPAIVAAKKSLFGLWCPMVRYLQEIVNSVIDDMDPSETWDPVTRGVHLDELRTFCSEASDLPRAFLLAVVCREAVSVATKQKEAKTYGRVSSVDAVKPWDELLRQLRVCLLISFRLHGEPLGPFPITVYNVNKGDIFSVHEWIARDELRFSHKQEEIESMEEWCASNSEDSFGPSTEEGDDAARWKSLQKGCKASAALGADRERWSPSSDDSRPSPLLLYMSDHNDRMKLAAHRAMLLGGKWGQEPRDLQILTDCLSTLKALEGNDVTQKSLAAAVLVEVWQVRIRPVYRALFFGFDDVPELTEDVVAPLCLDSSWLRGVAAIAREILVLISRTPWDEITRAEEEKEEETASPIDGEELESEKPIVRWPPVTDDFILKGLLSRSRRVVARALEVHLSVVCAAKVSDDYSSLSECVPNFYDLFEQHSLFMGVPSLSSFTERQQNFIQNAVTQMAQSVGGPVMDNFELDDIEQLGMSWGIEKTDIRTQFLLAMYREGKDTVVDELANASSQQLDISKFVEGGLVIVCRRLQSTIVTLRKAKQYRAILGLLDADMCQWVKEQSEEARPTQMRKSRKRRGRHDEMVLPLSLTHALILRLLGMSSGIQRTAATEKIHALSIMSGTLLKAMEEEGVET